MWSSGEYGFRDEAARSDETFQLYGQMPMDADGSNKRMVPEILDSMPLLIPATLCVDVRVCFLHASHQR